ncbi:MAG: UvrD-helicase domain-containing protein [Eubacteriales bacterium]|nr:UvrD-helicase domain-containing protein [Eubacteriales bacterium]
MKQIADLHIHSRYSMATSKEGTPEMLDLWARKKGISIVGTGDFTHPAWREELKERLVMAEDGLYKLKDEYIQEAAKSLPGEAPRFVITGEISSIYKKNGKTRKVHNLILLPSLEDAERFSKKLETIGNIHSDGRPILGLDCRDLLEIMLEICPEGFLVPAHIWTPHFSLFGAMSGFDTIEECFEDLTPHIHALETGLSSDPLMNWRISALDRFQLISNSDAHSPAKLGREANLLDIEPFYEGLKSAIQEGKGLEGTIEFFPEEGKYHFDGHRKCHICLSPKEAEKYNGRCPVCGKKLTMGVDHRIVQLADREDGFVKENAKPFESLVPLPEVIAASTGRSAASKKVQDDYEHMLSALGAEFSVLREIPVEDIRKESGYLISEGIRRLRAGQVIRRPGFDGEYGTIKLFENDEIRNLDGQMSLFGNLGEWQIKESGAAEQENERAVDTDESAAVIAGKMSNKNNKNEEKDSKAEETPANRISADQIPAGRMETPSKDLLNPAQQAAVESIDRAVAVIAGPGTGKTKTLVSRILYLLEHRKVKPSEITAVTFTNQAAAEMKKRLAARLGGGKSIQRMNIGTFHAISLELLKKNGAEFTLAPPEETLAVAKEFCAEYGISIPPSKFLQQLSLWKAGNAVLFTETHKAYGTQEDVESKPHSEVPEDAFPAFQAKMKEKGWLDFDDLLLEALRMAKTSLGTFPYLLVDEFQDISPLQQELIRAWNQEGRELFVIGDPDQSIYGFRGSDAHCFEKLKTIYPGLKVITLEENYRCTASIAEAAVRVISHNPGEPRKLLPHREKGIPVQVAAAKSKMSEAIFAAKEVNRLIGGIDMVDTEQREIFREEKKTYSFGEIAILYRTHHQARLLEKCLKKEGIPYVVRGREDFLTNPLVQGTIFFFRSLVDPEEISCAKEAARFLWGLQENALTETIYEQMKEKYRTRWKRTKPGKLLKEWVEDLEQTENEALLNLASIALCYQDMPRFLEALILGEEGDLKRCGGKSYQTDAVQLMTLHGSKGLEFPAVILYGVGKGEIPPESEKHPCDEEEERRLFYVGMTRAKEELILTYAEEPSPFLGELPENELQKINAGRTKAVEAARQLSLFDFL